MDRTILVSTGLFSTPSLAGLYLGYSFYYVTDTDSSSKLNYASMRNMGFLGAEIGSTRQFVLGWSVLSWNRNYKDTDTSSTPITMLETGPRIQIFFDEARHFFLSGAYHIYGEGTRKEAGESQTIRGSAYWGSLGILLRLARDFQGGFSYNYHSLAISKYTVGGTETKKGSTYTTMYPAIEFALSFR